MSNDQSYFFVCNPAANSGRMKKRWDTVSNKIVELFDKSNIEIVFTENPKHAMELTKRAMDNGYKNIIAVGGDGVANEVSNSILNNGYTKSVNFGLLPMGTSNDIQNCHDLPPEPINCLPIILDGFTSKIPVGKVSGDFDSDPYYFLSHADCGLAAMAAKSARDGSKLLKGEIKYTYHAIKKTLRFKKNPGIVTVDGEAWEREFTLIGASMGDMMSGYNLWPENNVESGDFGILLTSGQSRLRLLKLMMDAEKGNHIGKKGVDYIHGKIIEIELENSWPFQAEGEIFADESRNITIEYLADKMDLITNRQYN